MDDLDAHLIRSLELALGEPDLGGTRISAGRVTSCFRLDANSNRFFLKITPDKEAQRLVVERRGLEILREALPPSSKVRVPAVILHQTFDGVAVLVLEWIESVRPPSASGRDLGVGLGLMHSVLGKQYGWEHSNFIGDATQDNNQSTNWSRFFLERRLMPQVKTAIDGGSWRSNWDGSWARLQSLIGSIVPESPPCSTLHGDLWNGNAVYSKQGVWYVIDPAFYYGHAETDLAMMHLFGGFSSDVFSAYDSVCEPDSGRGDRVGLYNLYHLLNHLNLFGDVYSGGVARCLSRF